jgi:hypothetical protein
MSINLLKIIEQTNSVMEKLNVFHDRTIIPVLGCTGNGKSSFINFIQGWNFTLDTSDFFPKLIRCHKTSIKNTSPIIGDELTSCTLVPEIFSISDKFKNYFLLDTSGLNDSRGLEEDIFNSIYTNLAIKSSKKIKHIFYVIEESGIYVERSKNLKLMKDVLQRFIPENYLSSLTIVVTKGNKSSESIMNSLKSFSIIEKNILGEFFVKIIENSKVFKYDPNCDNHRSSLLEIIEHSKEIDSVSIGEIYSDLSFKLLVGKLVSLKNSIDQGYKLLTGYLEKAKITSDIAFEITEFVSRMEKEICNNIIFNEKEFHQRLDHLNNKLSSSQKEFDSLIVEIIKYFEKEFPNLRNIYDFSKEHLDTEGIVKITEIFTSKSKEDKVILTFINQIKALYKIEI